MTPVACLRCRRMLSEPVSIRRGFGAYCAKLVGVVRPSGRPMAMPGADDRQLSFQFMSAPIGATGEV